jgi:uncharacterized SAM-binding protein YcdF (DUF218 family)
MLSLNSAVTTRRLRSFAVRFSVLCGLAIILGFVGFVSLLPNEEIELDRNADGIVVLTGGTSRVTDALELLASGHGKRLLISGVNPGTTTNDIAHQVSEYGRILSCCVDLDYSALNTLGNAVETRRWVIDRGFHSLIIVTSAYHMPRALAEIAHQLPNVVLIPFPVVSDRLRVEPWWSNSTTTRLVLSEYFKYLFARVRMLPGIGHIFDQTGMLAIDKSDISARNRNPRLAKPAQNGSTGTKPAQILGTHVHAAFMPRSIGALHRE